MAVALGLFTYLALPTLRKLYGTVVDIPVYAALAILAGAITYSMLSDLGRIRERRHENPEHRPEWADRPDSGDDWDGDGIEEPPELDMDVDREMEQLREEQQTAREENRT